MRCDEFDVRLNQVLDRRRSPDGDPHLRHHAQVCPACREQLADHAPTVRRPGPVGSAAPGR